MIIDAHTHVWPDAIAARALAGAPADLTRHGDGTAAALLEVMDRDGIDRSVVLAVANLPTQVEAANRFAGSLDGERLIGFGSIHARLSPEENVASLRRHGLRGAKVHPHFQGYALDDPGLLATLDAMQGEFVVVVHVGAGGSEADNERSRPRQLRAIADALPGLDIVACHLGGYRLLEEAEDLMVGSRVHLDTAWPPSLADLDPGRMRALIARHGHDRVVFASDWPLASPAAEVAAIRRLDLDDEATTAVLGGTIARLLGVTSAA